MNNIFSWPLLVLKYKTRYWLGKGAGKKRTFYGLLPYPPRTIIMTMTMTHAMIDVIATCEMFPDIYSFVYMCLAETFWRAGHSF